MSISEVKKYQLSLELSKDIDVMLEPFKNIGINYFCWSRVGNDRKYAAVCSNVNWFDHFLQKKYHKTCSDIEFSAGINDMKIRDCVFWDPETSISQEMSSNFNLGNGISFLRKSDTFIDAFHFASTPHNHSVKNYYLSERHVLEQFIFYFQDVFSNKIKKILKENYYSIPIANNIDSNICLDKDRAITINDFPFKKIYLNGIEEIDSNKDITPTEYSVFYYLAQGYKIKRIAIILNKSTRTIETQIDTVKKRLNLPSNELILLNLREAQIIP